MAEGGPDKTLSVLSWLVAAAIVGVLLYDSRDSSAPMRVDRNFGGESAGERHRLVDGAYSCEVVNNSTGNGPYSLECTVAGGAVTIQFSNGGYINGTIDIEGPGPYEGEATDSRGNSWSIMIDR